MRNLLLILVASLVFFSCDDVNSYPEDLSTKQVFNFEVRATDWTEELDANKLNRRYICRFNINGLSNYVFSNGVALGYVDYGSYQQPLPYTRYFENTLNERWSRTIDFDYSQDDVTFYVSNSDFANDPPEKMYFRLVFMW